MQRSKTNQVDRLGLANKIVATFARECEFYFRSYPGGGKRLAVRSKYGQRIMAVRKDSGYPVFNYGDLGWGGTVACAMGRLAKWIQGKSTLCVAQWEIWCGPNIKLNHYGDTMALIRIAAEVA